MAKKKKKVVKPHPDSLCGYCKEVYIPIDGGQGYPECSKCGGI
jgi:hypothetical protein